MFRAFLIAAALICPLAGAGTASAAPSPVPCWYSGADRHHFCNFWPAGDGIHRGAVVVNDSGHWVGYLNHGANWVDCQMWGGKVTSGHFYNHWWAWTEADNHHWGWVNAVWAQGGDNDGKFRRVPGCDPLRDAPPLGQFSSGPSKPRPKPKPLPKNMVVLGDSYSSGEGAPLYTTSCYRSHYAYGYLVAHDLGYRMTAFEACGAATTSSVRDYQLGGLNASTTLVTISVGGDDADFIGVVGRCIILGLESACKNIIAKEEGVIRNSLPGRLDATYGEIRTFAPHARVVVVGYPHLWGACAKGVAGIPYLTAPADLLDKTIAAAAARHHFIYVDPRRAFTGHSICDKDRWINGLETHALWQSFHPNTAGYRELANLVEAALR